MVKPKNGSVVKKIDHLSEITYTIINNSNSTEPRIVNILETRFCYV